MAIELVAAVFAITLPFGAWRVTTRRYSLWWFLSIHVPIPFIFMLRMEAGYSYAFIPFTVGACVAGQLVGGRLGGLLLRRWRGGRSGRRRRPTPLPHACAPCGLPVGGGGRRSPAGIDAPADARRHGDGRPGHASSPGR
jgi:hypothetical protein